MGYQLYRMIRDGAPPGWTGPMIHVAQAIADDARDPDGTPQDGWPWSALPVEGHRDARGRWRDGLTERCGMSPRAISRALSNLAAAGYEMRQSIGEDSRGRPRFAVRGHATRFAVPPLPPRPEPVSPPSTAANREIARQKRRVSPPSTATPSPHVPSELQPTSYTRAGVIDGSVEVAARGREVNGQPDFSVERKGSFEDERRAALDEFKAWMAAHPESAAP